MSERVRARDWSTTPVGAIASWPSALRIALATTLASPFPAVLIWGPELIAFHNDAYGPLLGEKPDALGRAFLEVWPEACEMLAPLLERARSGESCRFKDAPFTLIRSGEPEEAFFDYGLSPVRDEEGAVVGVLNVAVETTAQVRAERRRSFRLSFEDQLRGLNDPDAIMEQAVFLLGRHLGVDRVGYTEIIDDSVARMGGCYAANGLPVLTGEFPVEGFGARRIARQRQGLTEVSHDVLGDPDQAEDMWAAIDTRSVVSVPLVRDGLFQASLYVNSRQPRRWSDEDVTMIEEVAARTWDAVTRARAEAALKASEEFNRRILKSSADCVKVLSPDGCVEFMSEGGLGVMEVEDPQAVLGAFWPGFWIGEGHNKALAALENARAGGTGRFQGFAATLKGTPRWWDVAVTPINGADGRPEKLLVVSRDVTATHDAEAALRELNDTLERRVTDALAERKIFADVFETSDASIQVIDREYNLLAINKANADEYERIYGRRPAVGDNLLDILSNDPEEQAGARALWARALAGEGFSETMEFGDRRHGRSWYQGKLSPLWSSAGEPVGASLFAFDVSERRLEQERLREAEAALHQSQKMEAVGQLTGGVAHDFNNLLTVIRGSVELLLRPDVPEEKRRRYIHAIADTSMRATKLTSQLLAFARRQALRPEVFDVGGNVSAIVDMMQSLMGARIVIETHASDGLFVNADPSQLDTALVNLAVNARDAMEDEGRLIIAVRAADSVPAIRNHPRVEGDFVAVSLTDTGAGVAPDQMDRIFEPFFTTKAVGKGTGLGLSQVFGFAKQSGGEVAVESEPGAGSTFTLYLPRVFQAGEASRESRAAEVLVNGGGACVLVVEDNPEVGEFAVSALSELGYKTTLAENAEAALEKLAEAGDAIEVVFSDVVMPGMNGVELAQEIRRRHPELPVLLASGYSHVLVEGGSQDFELLHKPYSIEQLSRLLRKAVGRRVRA